MRKNSASQSAIFNQRVSLAFVLCSVGTLLALLGFAATPTAITPPPRGGARMAYDATPHVGVLFGGFNRRGLNDTRTRDGRAWTQQHPATSPPARSVAGMAFDPPSP